jgi:uncharacterized membrane protein YdjX (TVP38/TMEM64 family)
MRVNRKILLWLALVFAVLVGATWLLYDSGVIDFFSSRDRLQQFIGEHRAYSALLFIGLQVVQVVAAPIPGEVTGFVGGVLFGPVWGIVLSTVGLGVGSWVAFMLARWLGRPLVERLVDAETIRRYDYVMRHKGLFLALLLFFIPGFPKDYVCYLLGLGHMSVRNFLLVSVSGRLLGTVLLTLGGTYFRDERWAELFVVVGIGVVAVLLAMIYREKLERLLRRMEAMQRLKKMVARHSQRGAKKKVGVTRARRAR